MRPVSVMGRSCTCLSKCAPTALALTLPGCTSQSFSSAGFRLGFAGGRHWQKQQEELSVSLPPLSPFCPQDLLPVCPLSLGFSPTSRQSVLTRPSLTLTPSSAVFLCSIAFKASSTMLLHFYFLTISISDHFCLHLATLLILLSHLPFLDSQHSDLLRAQRSFILVNALRDFHFFSKVCLSFESNSPHFMSQKIFKDLLIFLLLLLDQGKICSGVCPKSLEGSSLFLSLTTRWRSESTSRPEVEGWLIWTNSEIPSGLMCILDQNGCSLTSLPGLQNMWKGINFWITMGNPLLLGKSHAHTSPLTSDPSLSLHPLNFIVWDKDPYLFSSAMTPSFSLISQKL